MTKIHEIDGILKPFMDKFLHVKVFKYDIKRFDNANLV